MLARETTEPTMESSMPCPSKARSPTFEIWEPRPHSIGSHPTKLTIPGTQSSKPALQCSMPGPRSYEGIPHTFVPAHRSDHPVNRRSRSFDPVCHQPAYGLARRVGPDAFDARDPSF